MIKKAGEKLQSLQDKWERIKAYFRNNKTLLYFIPTVFFMVAIVTVFSHGVMVNNRIGFEVVQIDEPQPFGTYEVTVTDIQFNPETSVHRMDVFFNSSAQHADLFSYQLEVNAVAIADPTERLDVEIVRVTSQFFVIYIRDLPAGFNAIRKDIAYFTGEHQRATTSIRTEESQATTDVRLAIETDSLSLMADSLTNDIRVLGIRIEGLESEILELETEIATNLNHIEQLESDMSFQVGEHLATSQSRIGAFENQNVNLASHIEALENEIREAQRHIELITETINEL